MLPDSLTPLIDGVADDDRELDSESDGMLALARVYVVDDPSSLAAAADELNNVQKLLRRIEKRQREVTKPIDDARDSVVAFFRPWLDRCREAKDTLTKAMNAYEEQLAEQRREAEAEARRQWLAEQERLRAEARKAAEEGEILRADELQEAAAIMPVPVLDIPDGHAEGISVRETWSAQVTDLAALLRGVLDGVVPITAVTANQRVLDATAKAQKSAMKWPGVRVSCARGVQPRGR